MFFFTKLREVIWGKPAATKEERKLVVKIDSIIMSFICLMYWVNYLDRSNLNSAYVSGLKEDLNMHGTELNQINSVFYVGYTVSQIPNNFMLQKIRPQIYLPVAMFCWGLLTLGLAFVQDWHQVMAIRFCLGLFESATFVGSHYIMGSWYNSEEIGKRTAVFAASGVAGNMFSGFLQGAIHKNLNGLHGFAGWRWLFIIDFLITLPVGFLGLFIFPGHPETTKSRLFTAAEKQLAIERLPEPTLKRGKLGWSLIRRVLLSWEIYALSALAVFAGDSEMWADNAILNLYLKSLGTYSVELINYIPTAVYAVGMVSILLCSWYADCFRLRGGRWHTGVFLAVLSVISGAIMLKPPNIGAKFFALYINGANLGYRGVLFAWANDLMRNDDAKRAIVIGMMNAMTIAFYIWWTLVFYNTAQAPNWYEGSIAMIVNGIVMVFSVFTVVWFEQRQAKRNSVLQGEYTNGASDEDVSHIQYQARKGDVI